MQDRFEFRVFAPRLARARDLLNRRARFVEMEKRTDTYFLGNSAESALKLRDGKALDFKMLAARKGDYQLWRPAGMVRLPASGAELTAGMPEAPLSALRPGQSFEANGLTATLVGAGFVPVHVHKIRHRYKFDGALAEFTRIAVGANLRMETAAIEAMETTDLDALRARFGIGPAHNESYPEMLMRGLPGERPPGVDHMRS